MKNIQSGITALKLVAVNSLLLTNFAINAGAASLTYDIIFSGGTPTPTSGSFTYDTTASLFTSFNVMWNGVNINILPNANHPVTQNNPATPGTCSPFTGQQFYEVLINGGQCTGLDLQNIWAVYPPNPPGNVFTSSLGLFLFTTNREGPLTGGDYPDPTFVATYTSGTFEVIPRFTNLSVSFAGSGSGAVNFNPPDTDCTSDCTESYNSGAMVTLSASADPGSFFTGWSGDADCSDAKVTMDVAINCVATFTSSKPEFPWSLFLSNITAPKRLIKTNWSQSTPEYYKYFYDLNDNACHLSAKSENDKYGDAYVVGCSTIAVGQLINYYLTKGYRKGWLELMLKNVRVYPEFDSADRTCDYLGIATKNSYEITIDDWLNNGARELRDFLWAVALGLDVKFSANETSFNGDWRFFIGYTSIEDKMKSLLIERFRFNPNIFVTGSFGRLADASGHIVNSIDSNQPVLASIESNKGIGHFILIDDYRITSDGDFQVKINWGWGNNDTKWYSGTRDIVTGSYTWNKFTLILNTVPINY